MLKEEIYTDESCIPWLKWYQKACIAVLWVSLLIITSVVLFLVDFIFLAIVFFVIAIFEILGYNKLRIQLGLKLFKDERKRDAVI